MKSSTKWLLALVLTGWLGGAVAADPAAAEATAASICAACHGPDGKSSNPLWPNLAGQQEAYIAKAIRDYRSGARNDPLMSPIAQTLSDTDIDNLAAWFAGK